MATGETVVTGMLDRVRQMYCGLHGHDSLLQFEQDRMFLKCTSCGHETPGWDLAEAPPVVSHSQSDAASPRTIMRPQLVGARRVA
jgi:hypothetical protein